MSTRRTLIQSAAAAVAAQSISSRLALADQAAPMKGNIQHSVCKWCYPKVSLDDLSEAAKGIGLGSIELLGPDDWPTLAKHGLTCAMTTSPTASAVSRRATTSAPTDASPHSGTKNSQWCNTKGPVSSHAPHVSP